MSYLISVYVTVFYFHFSSLSKGVYSSECWVCSNGFLRLIHTKGQHESIIQVYGESMTYSSTLLDSSYQISAYFFHHDLQLVRAVNTK